MSTKREMVNGMPKSEIPEGQSGDWRVERFTVSEEEASRSRTRAMFEFAPGRAVDAGDYTRLMRGDVVVMSDTHAEMSSHWEPVYEAKGQVLIHGLGLGIILEGCLLKKEVEHVTVIEISQDVIKLIAPYFEKHYPGRFTIIEADTLKWRIPRGSYWDMVWFDIWSTLCGDHCEQMSMLKRRYRKKAGWRGCWEEAEMRRQNRESNRFMRQVSLFRH